MRNLVLAQIEGLSKRAVNCCRNTGVITLGDLFEYIKYHRLIDIPNCGQLTAKELHHLINRYERQVKGFEYNLFSITYEEAPLTESVSEPEGNGYTLVNAEDTIWLNGIYNSEMSRLQKGLPNKVKEIYPDAPSLLLEMTRSHESIFESHDDWSINEHFGFWKFCRQTFKSMLQYAKSLGNIKLIGIINEMLNYIDDKINQHRWLLMHSRIDSLLTVSE